MTMQKAEFLQATATLAETIFDGLTFGLTFATESVSSDPSVPPIPAPSDAADARAQTQPAPAPSIQSTVQACPVLAGLLSRLPSP